MRTSITEARARVFEHVRRAGDWVTNEDIAKATDVPLRTVARHTRVLAATGILTQEELSPAFRFRMSGEANKQAYYERLHRAVEIYGKLDEPHKTLPLGKESL